MRRALPWIFFGGLGLLAFAFALATEAPRPQSLTPSIDNSAPEGLRALFLQLTESGLPVTASRGSFEALDPGLKTLVMVSPEAREVSAAEIKALRARVEGGLTLVYVPAAPEAQPLLSIWLDFKEGGWLVEGAELDERSPDPMGTDAEVFQAYGPFHGLKTLRVDAERSIKANGDGWLPVAGRRNASIALWKREGRGSVLVLAGADLGGNRRIGLGDNLRFWQQLAGAGPMAFDEFHHVAAIAPGPPKVLGAVILQMLILAGLWIASRAIRFGPPRPVPSEIHRSTREYLGAMARLTRRAKVESGLIAELKTQLRRVVQERLGISSTAPDADVERELEVRGFLGRGEYAALVRALESGAADGREAARTFVGLAREVAVLQARVEGRDRAAPSTSPAERSG